MGRGLGDKSFRLRQSGRLRCGDGQIHLGADRSQRSSVYRTARIWNGGLHCPVPATPGRNTERVPGLNNWNVNLMKKVRITERFTTEFRTEFYNIWNHPQYGYYSVSSFGTRKERLLLPYRLRSPADSRIPNSSRRADASFAIS